jgi:hypothetical protein
MASLVFPSYSPTRLVVILLRDKKRHFQPKTFRFLKKSFTSDGFSSFPSFRFFALNTFHRNIAMKN